MSNRAMIVIPAHNEEETIGRVLLGLRQEAPECDRVVVNDGSKDFTGNIIDELGEKQIKLPCNLGYGRAVQTGIKYALRRGYGIIVSFDGDGQHQPEDVPRIINALMENDADLVIGSRYSDGSRYRGSVGRRVGQHLFSILTRLLLGKRIYDTSSGFKAFKADAAEIAIGGAFLDFHIECLVRLSMCGCKILEIPTKMQERTSGRSMYNLVSLIDYPLKTLLLTIVAAIDAIIARRAK